MQNTIAHHTKKGFSAPEPHAPDALTARPTQEEIAALAHSFWKRRNGNEGSAEEDWRRAEQELLRRRASSKSA